MTQEKEKEKEKTMNKVKLFANREPNNLFKAQQRKQKLISITEKANLFNQITIISNRDEATQNFELSICQQKEKEKKKSVPRDQKDKGVVVMEPESKSESVNNNIEQMDVDQPMATHLQDEILMDILKRLPVRSLLRFKCVSKVWKTLISDPYFKMMHLNHAKDNQNSQKFVISQRCPKDGIYSMYCLNLSSRQPVENVQKLDFPLISRPVRCAITCCCDGLVIIIVNDNIDAGRNIYLLWNPSTGESIVLPDAHLSQNRSFRLGLGYDPISGDYKILKIYPRIYPSIDSPGEILTLKSGSWRNIDKHPCGIRSHNDAIHYLPFVNEAFHWIGIFGNYSMASRNYLVVSFSISDEVYGDIPLPEQLLCLRGYISIGVSILEGMLCVYSNSDLPMKGTFKLWVLKDYSVKEYWTSLLAIEDPCISYMAIPKYRFADGELLYWCTSFGCKGHAFRTPIRPFRLWPRCDAFQGGIAFTESLISPKALI